MTGFIIPPQFMFIYLYTFNVLMIFLIKRGNKKALKRSLDERKFHSLKTRMGIYEKHNTARKQQRSSVIS